MADPLKILFVHGIGVEESDTSWVAHWKETITNGIDRWSPGRQISETTLDYNEIFKRHPLNAATVADSFLKLAGSGIWYSLFGAKRGFGGIGNTVRWTAGMVVQWADEDDLRAECRNQLINQLKANPVDVIAAHSLGTLVCYDAFARTENAKWINGKWLITFGSQIGTPYVRSAFGGPLVPVPAKKWFHLYNPNDHAFTASLSEFQLGSNFTQVDATFDSPGMLNHDSLQYLSHANVVNQTWRDVAQLAGVSVATTRALVKEMVGSSADSLSPSAIAVAPAKPRRRALLVGINQYPDPANQLEGCVNDVFQMSATLQEHGFEAEDIRVVLDERATTSGILERLHWLLDDAEDEQERVFFYSGHGAQLPVYAAGEKVNHVSECLVPYDFDWTVEHAITDSQFFDMYSQLPYSCRFLAMLDCCHSGGMVRAGGGLPRGLTPPDDIRHRILKWDMDSEMWVARKLEDSNDGAAESRDAQKYVGDNGATRRLGRSIALRQIPNKKFNAQCKALGHQGPYLPVILQACKEDELASEYRHGVISYGAFTYALTEILRNARKTKSQLSFDQLVTQTRDRLKSLGYDQTPDILGPKAVLEDAKILGSQRQATSQTKKPVKKRTTKS